jgi:hypothetical protein
MVQSLASRSLTYHVTKGGRTLCSLHFLWWSKCEKRVDKQPIEPISRQLPGWRVKRAASQSLPANGWRLVETILFVLQHHRPTNPAQNINKVHSINQPGFCWNWWNMCFMPNMRGWAISLYHPTVTCETSVCLAHTTCKRWALFEKRPLVTWAGTRAATERNVQEWSTTTKQLQTQLHACDRWKSPEDTYA